jgi:hypothetical protein
MKTITDKATLDEIIKQLDRKNADINGKTSISYEDPDKDIYIEASVVWDIRESENWITIDGRSYYEGTYTDVYGWDDLEVDAWIGDEKVDIDYDYIEQNLY